MAKARNPIRSYRWQRLRASLLAREPLCRKCRRPAEEIDHIVPRSKGGSLFDLSNLQPLCRVCHHAKTGREAAGDLPTVCIHGWRSDLEDACPDCAADRKP